MVESPRGHPYSKATFIMPLNEWVFLKHTHTLLSCSLTCLLFFYSPYITENTDTHTQTHMHRHVAVICPPWLPNLVQRELWKVGEWTRTANGLPDLFASIKLIVKLMIFSANVLQCVCC